MALQLIGLNHTFLREDNISLSMQLILTMIWLNMDFPEAVYLDHSYS